MIHRCEFSIGIENELNWNGIVLLMRQTRKNDNDVIVCLIAYHSLIQINELLMVIFFLSSSMLFSFFFSCVQVTFFYNQRQYNVMSGKFVWNEIEIDMNLLNAIFLPTTHEIWSPVFFLRCLSILRAYCATVSCSFCGSLLWVLWLWYLERLLSQSFGKTKKSTLKNASTFSPSFMHRRCRKRLEMMRIRTHVAVINSFKYSPKKEFVRYTWIWWNIDNIIRQTTNRGSRRENFTRDVLIFWFVFMIFFYILSLCVYV